MNSSSAARARTKRAQGLKRPRSRRSSGKAVTALTRRAELVDQRAKRSRRSLVVDSEDGAHDHRQGDPLGVGAQRERLADRPALHLAQGDLADQLAVAARSARRGTAAAAVCAGACAGSSSSVSTEFGPSAGSSTVAFASPAWNCSGEPVKSRFDQRRVGDVDEPPEERERDAEDVAVAALEADQEAERIARVAQRLERAGSSGRAERPLRPAGGRGIVACSIASWTIRLDWLAASRRIRRRPSGRRRAARGRRGGPSPLGRGPGARCRGRSASGRRPRRDG